MFETAHREVSPRHREWWFRQWVWAWNLRLWFATECFLEARNRMPKNRDRFPVPAKGTWFCSLRPEHIRKANIQHNHCRCRFHQEASSRHCLCEREQGKRIPRRIATFCWAEHQVKIFLHTQAWRDTSLFRRDLTEPRTMWNARECWKTWLRGQYVCCTMCRLWETNSGKQYRCPKHWM